MATKKRILVEANSRPTKYVARSLTAVAVPVSQEEFVPIHAPSENDFLKIETRFEILEAISEQIPDVSGTKMHFHWFSERDINVDFVLECMRIRFDHPDYVDFLHALLSPEADKIFDETKSVRSALLFVALYGQLSIWEPGDGKAKWEINELHYWHYFERTYPWIDQLSWPSDTDKEQTTIDTPIQLDSS